MRASAALRDESGARVAAEAPPVRKLPEGGLDVGLGAGLACMAEPYMLLCMRLEDPETPEAALSPGMLPVEGTGSRGPPAVCGWRQAGAGPVEV